MASLSYFHQRVRLIIQTLKEAIESDTSTWLNSVSLFQNLLETVGTPESVVQTLEFLKQIKAQALMHHIRNLEKQKYSKMDCITQIEQDMSQLLVKEMTVEEAQPNLFIQNDLSLGQRFKDFINDLSQIPDEDAENIQQLITTISTEFNYADFQVTFCKFLDQINNSLMNPQLELMAEGTPFPVTELENVRLRATDLVTVISKEDLQTIHKGHDPVLMDFLEHHNLLGIIEQKTFVDPDLSLSQSGDLDDGEHKSKHSKRKRPHEDSVSVVPIAKKKGRASQKQEWEASEEYEDSSPVESKSYLPMKEIARSVRKSSGSQEPGQDERSPRTPQRAPGTTITGQRKRKRWTDEEVDFLLEGVRLFGVGSWKDILNHFQFGDRTYVDLKDKFRNLRKHYSLEELLGNSHDITG